MTDYTPEELEAQEIIPQWENPAFARIRQERDELLREIECEERAMRLLLEGLDNMHKYNYRGPELRNWLDNLQELISVRGDKARELIAKVEK